MSSKRIRRSCNICYLPVESPLKCNECTFECCNKCILTWAERSRECPQCRKYRTFDIDYPNSETESVGSEMEVPWWITQQEITNFLHLVVLIPPPPPPQFDEFGQYIDNESENNDENEEYDDEVNYYELDEDDEDDEDDEVNHEDDEDEENEENEENEEVDN
jgi:hypothetical protein